MELIPVPIKEIKCTHAGQYRPYGDSFYVYDITLHEGCKVEEDYILDHCFREISKRKVQSRKEWQENHADPGKYFSGYYTLEKTPYGFRYTVCLPYTD